MRRARRAFSEICLTEFLFQRNILLACMIAVVSLSAMANTPTASASARWKASLNSESSKLSHTESDDWNLPGSSATTTRTRNAGSGRNRLKKQRLFGDSSSSDDESKDEESDGNNDEEAPSAEKEDDTTAKPTATRVILEVSQVKEAIAACCKCDECGGPMAVQIDTNCLASTLTVSCTDPECGFVHEGEPPASTTVHESNNDTYDRILSF